MPCSLFFFFIILLLSIATISEARDLLVGGNTKAWNPPSPSSQTLNQWAEATRFQIGDSLVWKLDGHNNDSVMQVTRADYLSCNTSSPIEDHREENVSVKLDRSGPYYFVSGESGRCEKGEKMAVVVMAERRKRRQHYEFFVTGGPSPAPVMAPVGFEEGPASAPMSGGARNVVGGVMIGLGMGMVMGLAL